MQNNSGIWCNIWPSLKLFAVSGDGVVQRRNFYSAPVTPDQPDLHSEYAFLWAGEYTAFIFRKYFAFQWTEAGPTDSLQTTYVLTAGFSILDFKIFSHAFNEEQNAH